MGRREGAYAVTRQLELSPATVLGGANSVTYVANPITSPFGEQLEEVLKDWAAIKLTADATADTGGNGLNEPRSRTCRYCRRHLLSSTMGVRIAFPEANSRPVFEPCPTVARRTHSGRLLGSLPVKLRQVFLLSPRA